MLNPTTRSNRETVFVSRSGVRRPTASNALAPHERPKIRDVVFRFLHALVAQILQTFACNAVHTVEARCCRWILMTHDRVGRNKLPLTQEFLAAMLAVRLPTVSVVTRTLQTAGLITQRRRAITAVNRVGLEGHAFDCYGAIRRTFTSVLLKEYSVTANVE
jgi:CRP-like cAMP-binding protein